MVINKKILHEFLRFVVVGIINTACNYGLFLLLLAIINLNYLIAGASGFMCGAITGFILNRKWTFNSNICYKSGMTKYMAIQIFCLGLHILTQMISTNLFSVPEILSQFIGIAITTFVNFFLIRSLIFKK